MEGYHIQNQGPTLSENLSTPSAARSNNRNTLPRNCQCNVVRLVARQVVQKTRFRLCFPTITSVPRDFVFEMDSSIPAVQSDSVNFLICLPLSRIDNGKSEKPSRQISSMADCWRHVSNAERRSLYPSSEHDSSVSLRETRLTIRGSTIVTIIDSTTESLNVAKKPLQQNSKVRV